MKSDKASATKYRSYGKVDQNKGHQRIETWCGNISSARKGSGVLTKSRQSLQSNSNKLSGGYKAYLTNKRISNHSRKKTSICAKNADKVPSKILTGSKSASKLSRASAKQENIIDTTNDNKRLSGIYKPTENYLANPINRKLYERPSYIIKDNISKTISTPTNLITDSSIKPSGLLTSRATKQSIISDEAQIESKKIIDRIYSKPLDEKRPTRIKTTDKVRSKGRQDATNNESSTNSSKISLKPSSSVSKSKSR